MTSKCILESAEPLKSDNEYGETARTSHKIKKHKKEYEQKKTSTHLGGLFTGHQPQTTAKIGSQLKHLLQLLSL